MPDQHGRTTEAEIAEVVLDIIYDRNSGQASIKQLIREIPNRMGLTGPDQEPSDTRPNEEIWEQRVRNIRSHQETAGNFIYEGYLDAIAGGYAITDVGKARVERRRG
jgi:hypothetical protein